jgi:hypothetical protein
MSSRFVHHNNEENYNARQMHSSFAQKPTSLYQLESQLAQFKDTRHNRQDEEKHINTKNPEVIPTTFDTVYDPNHPKADWSGFVKKNDCSDRTHWKDHRSQQIGLVQEEYGIISKSERQEFSHKRRDNYNPITGENNDPQPIENNVIGGIDISENEDRYKTNYQSLINQDKTAMEQMTMLKRALPRKNLSDPAQAISKEKPSDQFNIAPEHSYGGLGHTPQSTPRYESTPRNNINITQEKYPSNDPNFPLAGYRPPANVNKSFLSSIGSSIVDYVPEQKVTKSTIIQNKTLLAQNYNPNPGYTGRRKK